MIYKANSIISRSNINHSPDKSFAFAWSKQQDIFIE
jgi:hypothetical protein